MSYSTLEAEVEMDRASWEKDRRIAELEAEVADWREIGRVILGHSQDIWSVTPKQKHDALVRAQALLDADKTPEVTG